MGYPTYGFVGTHRAPASPEVPWILAKFDLRNVPVVYTLFSDIQCNSHAILLTNGQINHHIYIYTLCVCMCVCIYIYISHLYIYIYHTIFDLIYQNSLSARQARCLIEVAPLLNGTFMGFATQESPAKTALGPSTKGMLETC